MNLRKFWSVGGRAPGAPLLDPPLETNSCFSEVIRFPEFTESSVPFTSSLLLSNSHVVHEVYIPKLLTVQKLLLFVFYFLFIVSSSSCVKAEHFNHVREQFPKLSHVQITRSVCDRPLLIFNRLAGSTAAKISVKNLGDLENASILTTKLTHHRQREKWVVKFHL